MNLVLPVSVSQLAKDIKPLSYILASLDCLILRVFLSFLLIFLHQSAGFCGLLLYKQDMYDNISF